MNALWNSYIHPNLRILLLNNGGGEIFQTLPGLKPDEYTNRYVTASHQTSAKGWATDRGFAYTAVHNAEELDTAINAFTRTEQPGEQPCTQPLFVEVFTDKAEDVQLLKEYYHQLKNEQP